MFSLLSLMIGAYIITRMIEILISDQKSGTLAALAGATSLIAIVCVVLIFIKSDKLASDLEIAANVYQQSLKQ